MDRSRPAPYFTQCRAKDCGTDVSALNHFPPFSSYLRLKLHAPDPLELFTDRGRERRLDRSPSLRTGTADLPHPALQLVVLPPRGLMRAHERQRENSMHFNEHQHQLSPERRVNHRRFSSLSRFRHSRCYRRHRSTPFESTSLHPFAPLPLRSFGATMGALTPAHPALRDTRSMNTVSLCEQVSLINPSDLPDHSVSNHLMPRCCRFITLPLSSTAFLCWSRLRHWSAGSSSAPGRIEFVILRTDRLPPAALHHASLRRSCIWLQAGERLPGEDLHLSDHLRFQAHGPRASRPLRASQGASIVAKCSLQTFCSRCALTAGGTPAVPVKSSSGQAQVNDRSKAMINFRA